MEMFLNDKLGKISTEIIAVPDPKALLIIAHGAGAGIHHPFMQSLAQKIADLRVSTVRFNFPYMEQGKRSPGSPKTNITTWKLVIEYFQSLYPTHPIFISGKSYGGRMASHLLAENPNKEVKGIIYFGFPLHAPGKTGLDRAQHLQQIKLPQLFLQGTKDKLADLTLMQYVCSKIPRSKLIAIDEADHSFHVPKKSGKTNEEVIETLAQNTVAWIDQVLDG